MVGIKRSKNEPDSSPEFAELVHPIYLDTTMLLSFLAALEDGVTFSSEIAEIGSNSGRSTRETGAGIKVPSIATLLGINLEASGKYSRDSTQEQTVESRFVRKHTSASLFNRLRTGLHQYSLINTIEGQDQFDQIRVGGLIELSGEISPGPVDSLVRTIKYLLPFLEDASEQGEPPSPSGAQRRGASAEQQVSRQGEDERDVTTSEDFEATKKILRLIENDADSSPVVDLVLQQGEISVILTTSRESFTEEVNAALLGGSFSALGKVTAIEADPNVVSTVVRRGAFGIFGADQISQILDPIRGTSKEGGFQFNIPESSISGPFVQMIPLAIFI